MMFVTSSLSSMVVPLFEFEPFWHLIVHLMVFPFEVILMKMFLEESSVKCFFKSIISEVLIFFIL